MPFLSFGKNNTERISPQKEEFMVADIIISFLLQVVFTVGLIFLFGWLIALCNKKFYANFGRFGRTVCYVTGIIGTPVHELSHAVFCILFGHKITEIKLFSIDSADGTLGYVNHSYNRRNLYQCIGNFFIGVAPIVVISALLYCLARLLLPDFIAAVDGLTSSADTGDLGGVFGGILDVVVAFFAGAVTWQWWVFLLIGILLSLHMTLSGADIRNALVGLVALLLLLLLADVIIAAVSLSALQTFTQWVIAAGTCMLCFLFFALFVSLLGVLVSCLVRLLIKQQ